MNINRQYQFFKRWSLMKRLTNLKYGAFVQNYLQKWLHSNINCSPIVGVFDTNKNNACIAHRINNEEYFLLIKAKKVIIKRWAQHEIKMM